MTVLVAGLLGCTQNDFFQYSEDDVMVVESLPQDFPVPDHIWNKTLPQDALEKQKSIAYTSARVVLKEKNIGILKDPLTVLEFPRGGGEIDLSRVTTGNPGTFYVKIEVPELAKAKNKKVFFISQSRKRRIEGEILGSGCKRLLDITGDFLAAQDEMGIKVNTTQYRHLSLLGGHFIILGELEQNWMITQVTFFDPNQPKLQCPEFRSVE